MAALGIRYNNPGNIEYGPFARSFGGAPGGKNGRFAKFSTPEQGLAAITGLQRKYEGWGLTTVRQRISKWSPVSKENSAATVRNYVARVAATMGIDPDQPFSIADPELGPKFLRGMVGFENAEMPYTDDQFVAGHKLGADGPALKALTDGSASNLQRGMRGDAVKSLQEALASRGFDVGKIDGVFGPRTQNAVAAAEKSMGFAQTGKATPDLISSLQAGSFASLSAPLGGTQVGDMSTEAIGLRSSSASGLDPQCAEPAAPGVGSGHVGCRR
jgi:hypothetical protein